MGSRLFTMGEACQATGLSYETLKFYCREGLVPNVKRDGANRRVFDERDIGWVRGLVCLRQCGMGVAQMREYLELCLGGEGTIPERQAMLAKLRGELVEKLEEVQGSIDYIDRKQAFYDDVRAGRRAYFSNVAPEE